MTVVALLWAMAAPCFAAPKFLDDRDCAGDLRGFVQDYLASHSDTGADKTSRVTVAKTSLGPRDPEGYVIYVDGGGWCGSGGCHTLIVSRQSCRFEVVGFIGATHLPILIRRSPDSGDVEIVVTVRNAAHDGLVQAAMQRTGDQYDFRQRPTVTAIGPGPKMLIPAQARNEPLY